MKEMFFHLLNATLPVILRTVIEIESPFRTNYWSTKTDASNKMLATMNHDIMNWPHSINASYKTDCN